MRYKESDQGIYLKISTGILESIYWDLKRQNIHLRQILYLSGRRKRLLFIAFWG